MTESLASGELVRLPLVRVTVDRKDSHSVTNHYTYMEALLIKEVWKGKRRVEVRIETLPPERSRRIRTSADIERRKLAEKYEKHPSNKSDRLFDRVFPRDDFDKVFAEAVAGDVIGTAKTSAPAKRETENNSSVVDANNGEEPGESELEAINGIGPDLAKMLEDELQVYSIEDLLSVDEQDLIALPGLAEKSVGRIIAHAKELQTASVAQE